MPRAPYRYYYWAVSISSLTPHAFLTEQTRDGMTHRLCDKKRNIKINPLHVKRAWRKRSNHPPCKVCAALIAKGEPR